MAYFWEWIILYLATCSLDAAASSLDYDDMLQGLLDDQEWPDFTHTSVAPREKPSTAVRPTPSTNDPQRTIRHLEEQLHTCHATLHSLQSPRSSPAPHRAHPPPPVKTSMTTRVEHVLVESAEEMGDAMVGCVESVLYRVLAVIIHGLRVLAILVGILSLFMLFVTAAELVDVGSERTFSTFALLVTVGLWMGLSVTVYALQRIGGPPRGMTTGATHLSTI